MRHSQAWTLRLGVLFGAFLTMTIGSAALAPVSAQTAIPAITLPPSTSAPASAPQTNSPATAPAQGNLTTYRGDQFSIKYPVGWIVVPRDNNGLYFGPNNAPACGMPGLIISPVGLLSTSETQDIMLDNFLVANNYLTEMGARTGIGTLGRSATYEGPCTDGTTRKLRVTMYTASSKGFEVETFAPKAAFDGLDATFQQIAQSFTPLTATGQQPVSAPNHSPQTLLIHLFEGNVFMANVGDLPGTPLTHDANLNAGNLRYDQPAIAPGGKLIAYISQPGGDLFIAPIVKNGQPERLPIQSTPHFPIAWRTDGSAIAFVNQKGDKLTVNVLTLQTNVVAQVGELTGKPCPAAAIADPAAAAWAADLDAVDANGDTLTLDWINAGMLLVSTDCMGDQVGVLDLKAGQINPIGATGNFLHVVLSPDGSTLAGIANGHIALIHLADGTISTLPPSADRLIWSTDGSTLFYTTRTLATSLSLSAVSSGVQPFNSGTYQLTLHSLVIASGNDTQLYSGTGFAIGSLAPSPEGFGIAFTVIQDDSALLKILAKPAGLNDQLQAQPLPQAYWIPFPVVPDNAPTLLIDSDHLLFGPVGSQAVIGLPVTPPGPEFNNLGG